MVKIQTMSGFVCNVDERKARTWDFLEALAACEAEDESTQLRGMAKIVPYLLGKEDFDRLKAHTEKDGLSDVTTIMEEFKEILTQIGESTKK